MVSHEAAVWLVVCGLAACNNPTQDNKAQPSAQPPTTASAAPTPPVSAAPLQKVELEIESVGDTMTYDKTALSVPKNSQVHIVFKNNAKLEALPHNWVLVHEGSEARVAADGLALGLDAGYTPTSDDVLASVPLAPRGTTSEATFIAPKFAGKYPYICTVPGHYLMMKGVLTVTP